MLVCATNKDELIISNADAAAASLVDGLYIEFEKYVGRNIVQKYFIFIVVYLRDNIGTKIIFPYTFNQNGYETLGIQFAIFDHTRQTIRGPAAPDLLSVKRKKDNR